MWKLLRKLNFSNIFRLTAIYTWASAFKVWWGLFLTSILDCFMYARWIFWTGRLKSDSHVAVRCWYSFCHLGFVWTWAGSCRICYRCMGHFQFVASRIWNIEDLKYICQGKTSTLCIDQTAYNLLNCCLLVNQTWVKGMNLGHYCSNFLNRLTPCNVYNDERILY